jgi:hypothetical protein
MSDIKLVGDNRCEEKLILKKMVKRSFKMDVSFEF